MITDEIGAVEQSNFFDPWGRERKIITSGSIKQWLANNDNYRIANKPITTRGFTGHEQLAEVGLIHMNGRIYDGALGRFVQADPIIQDPLRVQSLNRYSYVWNNPLNATDPSGFQTCAGYMTGEVECTPTPESDGPKPEDKPEPSSNDGKTKEPQKTRELDKGGCWVNTCYSGKLPDGFVPNGGSENSLSNSATSSGNNSQSKPQGETKPATQQAQNGSNSAAANETELLTGVWGAAKYLAQNFLDSEAQSIANSMGVQNAESEIQSSIRIPISNDELKGAGIAEDGIEKISRAVSVVGMVNNVRKLNFNPDASLIR